MCRLDWFDEVYKRKPKPEHVARLSGHDYRVIIVVEDQDGHEASVMEEGGRGILHYAVVNDSHRRTVKATLTSTATKGAMIFGDAGAGAPGASVTRSITAYRKCHVEDPPVPFQEAAEIEVVDGKRLQEVFLTALSTEEESPRTRTPKREQHDDPLTNSVLIRRAARPKGEPREPAAEPGRKPPGPRRLDGSLFEQLSDALLDAFQTQQDLERMLRLKLNRVLSHIISPNDDLPAAVFKLIAEAEAEGWLERLILAARNANPGNPKLLDLAQRVGLTPLEPGLTGGKLERLVRETNTFLSVNQWRDRLGELEAQICRIEIQSPRGARYGTGFLVAADVVMTNYHVMQTVISGSDSPDNVTLRFDYKELTDGKTIYSGTPHSLALRDWLIDWSPNNSSGELPNRDELDYALLRVDGAPGEQPVGGQAEANAPRRKWVTVPEVPHEFEPNSPLFILQHPEARPLKLVIDTDAVIGVNANGTRVRYKTNTEAGSSGSPCFNNKWELVALHHSGDPNFAPDHRPEYNEGVPLSAILALLEERGLRGVLG